MVSLNYVRVQEATLHAGSGLDCNSTVIFQLPQPGGLIGFACFIAPGEAIGSEGIAPGELIGFGHRVGTRATKGHATV